jgi:membrane protease subunit HflC
MSLRHGARWAVAAAVLALALVAGCLVIVSPGQGVVITRLGKPVRVMLSPGGSFKWPSPIESTTDIDLRLRTTSSGLQDVGTRDGLRVLVQAYVVWRVPQDADAAELYLRSVQNQPDVAAAQLRSLMASSLEITASSFDLAQLVNTDARKVRLDAFEQRLRALVGAQARKVYGVDIAQAGIERLTLSSEALQATIERMKAERDTAAAQRSAEGQREAAQVVSEAERDARIQVAGAKAEAAAIEADAQVKSAGIYQQAYASDPKLYTLLRSFDTMDVAVGPSTRLVLRTDAAPFRLLVDGPLAEPAAAKVKP